MIFASEKTGKHLRDKTIAEGVEGRMRALQALNHGYGKGSRATIANMLLAALGGQTFPDERHTAGKINISDQRATVVTMQVAEPLQDSANDSYFAVKEVSSQN